MITTFEQLAEFIASNAQQAINTTSENERCRFIADATIETAKFLLAVSPSTMAHQVMVSGLVVENLRGFTSPFFVLAREMGTPEELHTELDEFIKRTNPKELH